MRTTRMENGQAGRASKRRSKCVIAASHGSFARHQMQRRSSNLLVNGHATTAPSSLVLVLC